MFLVAIVLHLLRVFFTGAFRKPRELTYVSGVLLLGLAMLEGFLGYSLLDDLLSGMGLAIAYGVAMSIPLIGGDLSSLLWGGEFPGGPEFAQPPVHRPRVPAPGADGDADRAATC